MRRITRTTLVCVDCRQPRLALRAMRLSLGRCEFDAAIFLTSESAGIPSQDGIDIVSIDRIADGPGYSRFMLKELVNYIASDFVQVVQWDGYVVDERAWTDEFLEYDYIGAPWWSRPEGSNVGNGGFSLRSRRLLAALADDAFESEHPEDLAIGVNFRARLESERGIRFAPSSLARRYAFEGEVRTGTEFGFHRSFNLPYFNDDRELATILGSLDDAEFCNAATVTLIERLASLGRRREAARYSRRLRNCKDFFAVPPHFRRALDHVVLGLAAPLSPCPCGSGKLFKACCARP